MKRYLFILLVVILLCSCNKTEDNIVAESQVQRYSPNTQQTVQPSDMSIQVSQEQSDEATQPQPDMYEQAPFEYHRGSSSGDSLGSVNFDNMPGVSSTENQLSGESSSEETSITQESYTEELSTKESATSATSASRQGSLTGSVLAGTVEETIESETTVVETTIEEETEITVEITEEPIDESTAEVNVSDLIPVTYQDMSYQMKPQVGNYSRGVDVQYTTRGEVAYKRDLKVPDVLGFDKDAYENYIINPELFKNGQTKLPKFSYYGYKIPYLYWYDVYGELLNPLPIAYSLYRNMFYFADYAVVDPYAVTESEAESETKSSESSISETTSAYKETKYESDEFKVETDSKTELDFYNHAEQVRIRVEENKKKLNYAEKIKTDNEMKMYEAEIEYANSIGLGGYYEGKIGPGFQGDINGAGNTYQFVHPKTGKQYELTALQMKELLGSGEWRRLNADNIK